MSLRNLFLKYRFVLIILLLVGISLLSKILTVGIKIEAIRNFFAPFGVFAPMLYIAIFALDEIIPGGSTFNSILFYGAGFIFKPELAVVYTLTADTFGITINFLLARYFGFAILKKFLSKNQYSRIESFTKNISWELIFLFRLIPFVTTFGIDIISYAAGLSKISLAKFIISTLIPWAIVDIIQFYSINHFVISSNALFLLPIYLLLTIPLSLIILRGRPQYKNYFKHFYEQIAGFKQIIQAIKNLFN